MRLPAAAAAEAAEAGRDVASAEAAAVDRPIPLDHPRASRTRAAPWMVVHEEEMQTDGQIDRYMMDGGRTERGMETGDEEALKGKEGGQLAGYSVYARPAK
eukprot:CAMPEP_0171586464 /NCGR_PEP_ID=MMETSP0961-20121227/12600_1 /TAXON_ID=87120 /ORGANISM="Aurantiochytrium limacinum, Strain ATCCMYA-1381" /LENGTH=100 /DNA_ID=CAMNT_0012144239 /DNA_START=28 /DNA_END=329 /DNA_ORIENTATION=-